MYLFTSTAAFHAWTASAPNAATVLVPTMGALHDGHASLIRRAVTEARTRSLTGGCVVTIFVNPTQFNNPSDLARYPRTLDADLAICEAAGAAAVFAPNEADIYPRDTPIVVPPLPSVATQPALEDAFRPGHFSGVCQVVARLFDLTRPRAAIFGEKDWQQLQVIRAMTTALALPIDIIPAPTLREPDGLAMSSRNRFLDPASRTRAVAISRALREAGREPTPAAAEARLRQVLAAAPGGPIEPEYAVVRDADSLGPTQHPHSPCRALIAAQVGTVRLIDNAPWPASAL